MKIGSKTQQCEVNREQEEVRRKKNFQDVACLCTSDRHIVLGDRHFKDARKQGNLF